MHVPAALPRGENRGAGQTASLKDATADPHAYVANRTPIPLSSSVYSSVWGGWDFSAHKNHNLH
jgi:hypothetical protein